MCECMFSLNLMGKNSALNIKQINMTISNSSTHSLTDVDHVYIHGVGEVASQCVGGHHGDVVVHPDGCIVLVEKAGVFPGCVVVGTFIHRLRATRKSGEWHV